MADSSSASSGALRPNFAPKPNAARIPFQRKYGGFVTARGQKMLVTRGKAKKLPNKRRGT